MRNLILVVALCLAPVLAMAQNQDGNVHACVNDQNGQVRIVGPHEACKTHETPATWPASNQSGTVQKASCPADYQQIDLTNSTLCIATLVDAFGSKIDWNTGSSFCFGFGSQDAKLCTHQQMRTACLAGFGLAADLWLADRTEPNVSLVSSFPHCEDFDEAAGVETLHAGAYCCLEWMKY